MNTQQTPTGTRNILTTLEEVRAQVTAVADVAQRTLAIYTPDLEPQLYDQDPFLEAVKRLVLARRYARVRVLIADPGRAMRDGNRFLSMARRLTSYIDLRNVAKELRDNPAAFIIADEKAIVYRQHASRWDSIADLNDPIIARRYLAYFDEVWHASECDLEIRTRLRV